MKRIGTARRASKPKSGRPCTACPLLFYGFGFLGVPSGFDEEKSGATPPFSMLLRCFKALFLSVRSLFVENFLGVRSGFDGFFSRFPLASFCCEIQNPVPVLLGFMPPGAGEQLPDSLKNCLGQLPLFRFVGDLDFHGVTIAFPGREARPFGFWDYRLRSPHYPPGS